VEKATGLTKFVHDMYLPNMLYGKIFRSTVPHAKIISMDVSKAKKLPGVKAVITSADIPKVYYGIWTRDMLIFASDTVRYIGEPVAAVAADTEEIAEEALGLIEVEYEELPAVFNVEEAFYSDKVIIHPNAKNYWRLYPESQVKGRYNINSFTSFYNGDVEKGFKQADVVVEQKFSTQVQHQAYMERRVAIADYSPVEDKLMVWTSAQSPCLTVALIGRVMEMPLSKIRVIAPAVGGGFGGKANPLFEPHAAFLSKATGKPVRIELTRDEDFATTNPRHATVSKVKIGAKKDGKFTAFKLEWLLDSGAYTFEGPAVCDLGSVFGRGPYWFPNWHIEGFNIYTNKIVPGAFRGFGNPQVSWARETVIDMLAEKLGMSKLELVRKNLVKKDQPMVTGQTIEAPSTGAALIAIDKEFKLENNISGRVGKTSQIRGKGFSCLHHCSGILASSAVCHLHEDGSLVLLTGVTEIGGSQATSLASIAGEVLGIPLDRIKVLQSDTDATPYEWATVASRGIRNGGAAVKLAAEDAKKQLLELATRHFGPDVKADQLDTKDNFVYMISKPKKKVSIEAVCFEGLYYKGGAIIGRGSYYRDEPPRDPKIMAGIGSALWADSTEGVHAIELEVDEETGVLNIIRLGSAINCGQAINPMTVEGQMDGGIAQGLGYGMMEGFIFDNGKIVNPSFLDYTIPTSMDMPSPVNCIIEIPSPDGPFGALGPSESATVGTAPAINSAVFNAVGVRIFDLPITPYKVLKAIREKNNK
jgi:CO/xanthine dehydrogenase Mo-binding subunit